MPRLSLSANEKKAKRRNYTRENRELWKKLGFRMLSAPVHDEDRELILAELEVRRALRQAGAANDPDTHVSILIQIGRRNMSPSPVSQVMKDFLEKNARKDNFYEIEEAVNEAKAAQQVFRNSRTNIDRTEDDLKRQRLFAKEVAYGNLAAAWWRLANVRADMGEVTKNVFNMAKDHVNV